LDRVRFKQAEYSFQVHNAIIPEEDTLEDVKRPDYWSIISNSGLIRDGDEIRMVWEDDSKLARGFVLQSGKQWAHVKVLETFNLQEEVPEIPAPLPDGYKIIWRGRHHRFGVRRESDGAMIKGENGELYTRTDAQNWLKEHLKAVA
jgi:hypothetical protein